MINNFSQLLKNSYNNEIKKGRKYILNLLSLALKFSQPENFLKNKIIRKDKKLIICNKSFNLGDFKNIFVVGAGKATYKMAKFIEKILLNKIRDGYINIPKENVKKLKKIKINFATHPIPSEKGIKGAKKILKLTKDLTRNDLVIFLLSGGASALLPLPKNGISLKDKQKVTKLLIRCGASIDEINTIRKHLSEIKGGYFIKHTYSAKVISLIISDVVGDKLDIIGSGPTLPDSSTYNDCWKILKKYNLINKTPNNIKNIILDGMNKKISDTPKPDDKIFKNVSNFLIGKNRDVLFKLYETISKKINTKIFNYPLKGDVRQIAKKIFKIIKRTKNNLPQILLSGGETTVKVKGNGRGGRNQELILLLAKKIRKLSNTVVCASIGTDGIDGNSPACGAICDNFTIIRKKLNPDKYLNNNDSYKFFKKINDCIISGRTGTNVNDIFISYINE